MRSLLSIDPVKYFEAFYNAFEKNDQGQLAKLRVSLQAFFDEPKVIGRAQIQAMHKAIQAFSVSTDFQKLVSDAFSVTIAENYYDLGYEAIFKSVPVGEYQDTWDIYTVTNGLTFNLVPEGNSIAVQGLKGTVVTCHTDYYGGALGWTHKMITKRKVAAMLDLASIFRNNFFQNKANNFYLLIAAAVAASIALYGATPYQGVVANGRLQRDIMTINAAVYALCNRNRNKGYGDVSQIPIVGYRHPLDESRIDAAMMVTSGSLATAGQTGDTVKRPIRWITTYNGNVVQGRPFVVIPFNKIQMADIMPPTTFNAPLDVLTLNSVQAVWAEYGGGIGDVDVFQGMILA